MGLLRHLPFHLCWFTLNAVVASTLVLLLGAAVGWLVAVLLLLPALGLVPEAFQQLTGRKADVHGLALALSILSSFGISRYLPGLPALILESTVRIERMVDLAADPGQGSFRFVNANVRHDHAYRWEHRRRDERRGGTTLNYYAVAPIVDAGWTPERPVHAWAVCDGNDARDGVCAGWERPNAEAVVAFPMVESYFRDAARSAADRHGLNVDQDARLLVWVPDARQEISRRARMVLLSVYGLWLLFEALAAAARCIKVLMARR